MEGDNGPHPFLFPSQSSGGNGHPRNQQFKFFKRQNTSSGRDSGASSQESRFPISGATINGDTVIHSLSKVEKNRPASHPLALSTSPNPETLQDTSRADSQRNRLILGSTVESRQGAREDNVQPRSIQTRNSSIMHSYIQHPGFTLGDSFQNSSPVPEGAKRITLNKSSTGIISQNKLSGNLFQRFDAGQSLPAPQLDMSAASRPSATEAVVRSRSQHSSNFEQPAFSRSASVVSSAFGRQDEDISSIMMRGATDLRNTKFEVEEQRREIVFLQSQLEIVKNEKDEALKRLKAVKDSAKKSLESSSQRYTDTNFCGLAD
ncbi:hypothetical protein B0H21DRAFT_183868 [Amylocystis lapponica]|nr:hypothetical protein B0H21DRAFT_183868 [Amylocystis lapponica]